MLETMLYQSVDTSRVGETLFFLSNIRSSKNSTFGGPTEFLLNLFLLLKFLTKFSMVYALYVPWNGHGRSQYLSWSWYNLWWKYAYVLDSIPCDHVCFENSIHVQVISPLVRSYEGHGCAIFHSGLKARSGRFSFSYLVSFKALAFTDWSVMLWVARTSCFLPGLVLFTNLISCL